MDHVGSAILPRVVMRDMREVNACASFNDPTHSGSRCWLHAILGIK